MNRSSWIDNNHISTDQSAEPIIDQQSSVSIFDTLQNPPTMYRAIPFWSWNDDLDPQEIRRQVGEMKAAGLGGYIMHARAGLETPYMGERWMECIRAGIEEGQRLGMNVWCYDENGWPSGFADGVVPQLGLDYQQKWLKLEALSEQDDHNIQDDTTIAWYRIENEQWVVLDERYKEIAQYRAYYEVNPYYIDTLDAQVVQAFIESTYEKYHQQFATHFGQAIAGVFTDEPQYGRYQIPWSFTLEQQFQQTYGYSLLTELPLLFQESKGYETFRYQFWQLVTALFSQSFMKQIGDWCEERHIRLTGHVVCEDHLTAQVGSVGDAMASYEYMQTPGIDWLGRGIDHPLTPKQVSSVAHQLGQKFVLSETFGCSGWNVSFADLKWIAEWQYVHGVNLMCQHLEGYSLRGIRKRDYPPSLYYQQPWWEEYHKFNDYFGRLSMLLAESQKHIDILLLHPIRSSWIAYNDQINTEGERIHQDFVQISQWLCELQRSHDYGSESIIAHHGRIQDQQLWIGEASYQLVILPPMITIASTTIDLLLSWLAQGGQAIALGTLPVLIDGQPDQRLLQLEQHVTVLNIDRELISHELDQRLSDTIKLHQLTPVVPAQQESISLSATDHSPILTQRSTLEQYELYYLVNTDRHTSYMTEIEFPCQGHLEQINLQTGDIRTLSTAINAPSDSHTMSIKLTFAPAQSYLFRILPAQQATDLLPIAESSLHSRSIISDQHSVEMSSNWRVMRSDLNSLTLDRCRLQIDKNEWSEPQPIIFLQDQLVKIGRAVDIGLSFEVQLQYEPQNHQEMYLVIEQPHYYRMTINGTSVDLQDSGWWRDISFRKINIQNQLHQGVNQIVLERHFQNSQTTFDAVARAQAFESESNKLSYEAEIESIYILGDFDVHSLTPYEYETGDNHSLYTQGEFVLQEVTPTAHTGDLTTQGLLFYAGNVKLQQSITLPEDIADRRIYFQWDRPDAVLSKLWLNGQEVHTFLWAPYEVEITSYVHSGANEVIIELFSSCRNLLGPHHHIRGELTMVGPDSFKDTPSWTDGDNDTEHIYTPRYCMVTFGLTSNPVISMY
ncbi:glycosyl hydrolase [Paenibacillus sp. PsM32]|uniref:glycosyl hydrolase n=1 Tax=Paenibacillus sp. PsM32 TaxID=3030536 RepID=UPI00263BC307|nr:glycosyl hydrolase [Paenibacillus sp. PsM32]MDN4617879.1 glycosyl hydrolase [Paenibacillus sp. PsM32]